MKERKKQTIKTTKTAGTEHLIGITDAVPRDYRIVGRDFYQGNTVEISKELLGKYLLRFMNGSVAGGMIVETEAYYGPDDPASHAYRGKTARNELMFGEGGYAYIYFIYGNHYLLNIVAGNVGVAGAVLIRGIEPTFGKKVMRENRCACREAELTNGPGKLTQVLDINGDLNGSDITSSEILIVEKIRPVKLQFPVKSSSRIGISNGKDLKLRYYLAGHPGVSASPRK